MKASMRESVIREIDEFRNLLSLYLVGHSLSDHEYEKLRDMTTLCVDALKKIQVKINKK